MHRMHAKASPASKHQRKMQTMGLVSAEEKVKRGGDCRCGGGRHFEVWWWPIVRSDAFLERKHPASVIVALSCLSLDWVSVILAFLLFMRSEYTREKISRFLPGYRRNSREGGNPVVFWEKISINTEDISTQVWPSLTLVIVCILTKMLSVKLPTFHLGFLMMDFMSAATTLLGEKKLKCFVLVLEKLY